MFKKHYRLNTSEFKEVFTFGKTSKNQLFILKSHKNQLTYSRFAVVVSKKIAKRAVERNYLKRKFIHALKEVSNTLPVSDYVFILNSSIKDIQYKDLLINLEHINL
jgi:ribonuclease P protein component